MRHFIQRFRRRAVLSPEAAQYGNYFLRGPRACLSVICQNFNRVIDNYVLWLAREQRVELRKQKRHRRRGDARKRRESSKAANSFAYGSNTRGR
jgi:hypothetical protein